MKVLTIKNDNLIRLILVKVSGNKVVKKEKINVNEIFKLLLYNVRRLEIILSIWYILRFKIYNTYSCVASSKIRSTFP